MFQVSREIHFCYGHRLLHYEGKCRHLHGHNGKAVITLRSSGLNRQGMVLDFSEIKRTLAGWIDENLDHRMILHRDDPAVPGLLQLGEPLVLVDFNPTAENLARMIYHQAKSMGLPVVSVRLWETPSCCARYCPEAT
jgi:6-pyruvoyltetrahydropterin/6-carboxytetrahydropterin synthase